MIDLVITYPPEVCIVIVLLLQSHHVVVPKSPINGALPHLLHGLENYRLGHVPFLIFGFVYATVSPYQKDRKSVHDLPQMLVGYQPRMILSYPFVEFFVLRLQHHYLSLQVIGNI